MSFNSDILSTSRAIKRFLNMIIEQLCPNPVPRFFKITGVDYLIMVIFAFKETWHDNVNVIKKTRADVLKRKQWVF